MSDPVRVTAVVKREPRRLFVLAAGIRFYESLSEWQGDDMDLPGGAIDAVRMVDFWEAVVKAGGYAADAGVKLTCLTNQQVTVAAIREKIAEVRKAARPDDVFVLFLSGHGVRLSDRWPKEQNVGDWYYVIPRTVERKDGKLVERVLKPEEYDRPDVLREAWLRDSVLAEELASLKCTPLLFLDCCQSGAAGSKVQAQNTLRGLSTCGLGPIVIAACDGNQSAWEPPGYRGGVFSREIGRTLEEDFVRAGGPKKKLTITQFYSAVRDRTADGVIGIRDRKGQPARQTPQITPPLDALRELDPTLVIAGEPRPDR